MESWKGESDVTPVANAILERKVACRAFADLARYSKSGVEGAVCDRGSIVFHIIESALGDLQHALADNILDRPRGATCQPVFGPAYEEGDKSYCTPNFISLKRLGRLSTTCSFGGTVDEPRAAIVRDGI